MFAARPAFGDPAAEAARFLCRLALIILMILTPLAETAAHGVLYVLLPVGASVLVISGALSGGIRGREHFFDQLISPIGLTALFLAFWAALSLIWTPFSAEAAARFGKALGTGVVVLFAIAFLPEKTKASNLYLLPIGVGITAIVTALIILFGPQTFWKGADPDYTLAQRCIMSVSILLWPALGALALREHWITAAALAAVVTMAALTAFEPIALVAIAVGAVVYAIAMTQALRTAEVAAFAMVCVVLLAPIFALFALPVTALAHLPRNGSVFVFANVVATHWPRLITGHGLDFAARAIELGVLPPDAPRGILFTIWYELGLLGAVAFAILSACVFLAAGRAAPHAAPALIAGLVAGLVIALLGAETTQLWWITLSGLAAIAFALLLKGHPRAKRPPAPVNDEETDQALES